MNTRRKGRVRELRARDTLEELGYKVQLAPLPQKWSTQNDLWGLFDLCAVRGTDIRFIQIKTNKAPPSGWKEAAKEFQVPANCTKEYWVYKDGNVIPNIYIYAEGSWQKS